MAIRIIRSAQDIDRGLEVLAGLDARLASIRTIAGPLPLRLSEPGFAGLAHIVVSQMVSKASAAAIWRRMEAAAGTVTAERFLGLDAETRGQLGLSRAKADTLSRVAKAAMDGSLDLQAISMLEAEAAIAALTAIKGIGPWTAEIYLMFCGGHPDIFPSGDVALRAAVGRAFEMEMRPSPRQVEILARSWAPWRSVAARLFWAYYAAEMRRDVLPLA